MERETETTVMANPDGRIPEKRALIAGPFTRFVRFTKAPISEEVSRLQERITSLEADLAEAKRSNTEAARDLQRKMVEERLADLPSNEVVLLARTTLTKNELAKEQRRSKQIAAEADSRVQQKQLEIKGELQKLEADWRGRLERRNADVNQLRARERWLWKELQAARSRIQQLEARGPPRGLRPGENRPAGAGAPRERAEADARVPAPEAGATLDPPSVGEFCALLDQTGANLQSMRSERDKLLSMLEATELQLADARDREVVREKDLAQAIEARQNYQGCFAHQQKQISLLGSHGKEMTKKAEAAEAEVRRLRASEAEREQEKITANSKVEGMDAGDAYFLGFDECRKQAEALQPGISKGLHYPLDWRCPRQHSAGGEAGGVGSFQGPIDLNGAPPNM